MRCLFLAVAMLVIVTTVTARRLKRQETEGNGVVFCNGEQHPLRQCRNQFVREPIVRHIHAKRRRTRIIPTLQENGTLPNFCRAYKRRMDCIRDGMAEASVQCHEEYASIGLTNELVGNVSNLVDLICTEENLQKLSSNIVCLFTDGLYKEVLSCGYENPNHNCSEFDHPNESDESRDEEERRRFHVARRECHRVKNIRNCNDEAVINCASEKVSSVCGNEAGELIALVATFNSDLTQTCLDVDVLWEFIL